MPTASVIKQLYALQLGKQQQDLQLVERSDLPNAYTAHHLRPASSVLTFENETFLGDGNLPFCLGVLCEFDVVRITPIFVCCTGADKLSMLLIITHRTVDKLSDSFVKCSGNSIRPVSRCCGRQHE